MKTFKTLSYTVENIERQELKSINGGSIGGFLLGLVGAAVYDCIANHEAFVEGFKEGYKR